MKIWFGAILAGLMSLGLVATPVWADEGNTAHETFSLAEADDEVTLDVGKNLLIAGNSVMAQHTVNGLLFSAGNQLELNTVSEYAFVAGNIVNFKAETEKDVFLAGNFVTIENGAKVGRDVFATGNIITVYANLPGDLSVAASKVVLKGVNIKGNVNLDVEEIVFEGKSNIEGKLTFNNDAKVDGMANVSFGEIERYENIEIKPTATDIVAAKIYSIFSLFIVMVVIFAMFPRMQAKIDRELSGAQFGKDLLVGMCTLLFVPIVAIFLLMSIIGAPLAIILIAVYIISLYVAQAFTGVWLGKMIVEKFAKTKINVFVEGLIGIAILGLAVMVPFLGAYIGLISTLLGLGLIMQVINTRGRRYAEYMESKTGNTKKAKTLKSQKAKKLKKD